MAISLEREGATQLKNGLICREQAYCFQAFTYAFCPEKNLCFWPFKMGSIVQSIFISLWCVCFASAEAKCHICHVCSGFYSLLLITLYRPMREPASINMNWQAHVLFSLPECTGLLYSWQFFFCIVWGWLFFPNIFGGPLIFNDIMKVMNFDHDP